MANKILVVDDSMTARKLVKTALEGSAWEIIEAKDGNEGLEKLAANPDVKLILSDINMPWKSGIEMVEEIKGEQKYSAIPICMLTTESGSDTLEKAKELGITAFLVKPVQKDQLLTLVESIMEG
jgi:two-component system chemotaxis response regulator CheY